MAWRNKTGKHRASAWRGQAYQINRHGGGNKINCTHLYTLHRRRGAYAPFCLPGATTLPARHGGYCHLPTAYDGFVCLFRLLACCLLPRVLGYYLVYRRHMDAGLLTFGRGAKAARGGAPRHLPLLNMLPSFSAFWFKSASAILRAALRRFGRRGACHTLLW